MCMRKYLSVYLFKGRVSIYILVMNSFQCSFDWWSSKLKRFESNAFLLEWFSKHNTKRTSSQPWLESLINPRPQHHHHHPNAESVCSSLAMNLCHCVLECWASSKPNSTLHFETFSACKDQGWKERDKRKATATLRPPQLTAWLRGSPASPPPFSLSFSLSCMPFCLCVWSCVHLVTLLGTVNGKSPLSRCVCVRLSYLHDY